VLFSQVVGRAVRNQFDKEKNLTGCIVSHQHFKQRRNYESYLNEGISLPEDDPEEEPSLLKLMKKLK